jgi:signal transduction histidine kinase
LRTELHDPALPHPGRADRGEHLVHFYDDGANLVRVVSAFTGDSLRTDGAALLIAEKPRLRDVLDALEEDGLDTEALVREGRLVTADAEAMLARFMVGDDPDPARFHDAIEPLVLRARAACATGVVCAYGEMVDVMWRRGNAAATHRIEELWTELVEAQRFALLCGYRMAGFATQDHADAFDAIAEQHGAVLPSGRYLHLERGARRRHVAELERRAASLEAEIARRRHLDAELKRLFEAERLARAEVSLLFQLTDAAYRAETLEQVYSAALDGIAGALGVERASILLLESDGVMRFKAWRGLSEAYLAAVEGHSPWPVDGPAPEPILCEDVREDERTVVLRPVYAREGIGAVGFFPLCSGGRLVGKFTVCYPRVHAFTDDERRLGIAIADQIAFAVDRKLTALERERLMGIVGHDLRNPLNAITMSAAALLKREDLGDAFAKPVQRIVASAQRMARIIRQLLDFAAARQGGGLPVHPVPADLAVIARNVVDELAAANPGRQLALDVEGSPAGEWDPDLLGEVFSNLVGNALQHGGDGPVTVRIRGASAHVLAEVHNGGPAIPPELRPHLFDPFRRGRSDGGSQSRSVGLGLFITREIVRAHRGTIEVTSSEPEGTRIALRLPRKRG